MSGFFQLENLKSNRVVPMVHEPWDSWTKYSIPDEIDTKSKARVWNSSVTTKHCFFSAIEALNPNQRTKARENPPHIVYGLVVDYDFPNALEKINLTDGKTPSDLLPAYGSGTFSGNARAVWLFEEGVQVANKKHADAFLKALADKCCCDDWFPGYEEKSAVNSCHYYEIGTQWVELYPEYKISKETLHLCAYEASNGLTLADGPDTQYSVPIGAVAEEVEKQFPGRWQGSFDLGARGPRFWDPSADNPTAAVVTEQGMLCFTGGQTFVPWTEIFGREFVRQFEGNMIAEIRSKSYYDGQAFWMLIDDGAGTKNGMWIRKSKDDYSQYLRVAGFNSSRRRGAASEIDRIENDIKTYNLIEGAFPFIHHKPGFLVHNGKPFLNVSTAEPIEPAPPGYVNTFEDGRNHFPFLYQYLTLFFEAESSDEEHSQLEYFLAWLWHFYTNAYAKSPQPGHAIFLAGPTGKGKTLMARGLIGKLAGGYADAGSYLVDGSQWTDDIVSSPLIAVEDSQANTDVGKHTRYSALIKKIVANFTLPYNGKYKSQNNTLPWLGRIIVTCNVDPESLRILPSLEISNKDKISLFKTRKAEFDLPDRDSLEVILDEEVPFLARFLLDWQPPKSLMAKDPRFGVKPYHHVELQWEAAGSGTSAIIFELLVSFLDTYFSVENESDEWTGTATQLYNEIGGHNDLIKKYSVQQLGIALGTFVAQGWNIKKPMAKTGGLRIWRIPKDLKMDGSGLE